MAVAAAGVERRRCRSKRRRVRWFGTTAPQCSPKPTLLLSPRTARPPLLVGLLLLRALSNSRRRRRRWRRATRRRRKTGRRGDRSATPPPPLPDPLQPRRSRPRRGEKQACCLAANRRRRRRPTLLQRSHLSWQEQGAGWDQASDELCCSLLPLFISAFSSAIDPTLMPDPLLADLSFAFLRSNRSSAQPLRPMQSSWPVLTVAARQAYSRIRCWQPTQWRED
mmetsp:Transcript_32630/g.66614  ORF Transcript_32630/g.66614 Transcript_32630/m.66614 type:complete len:223 (+) Transcript_32630:1231-1899(+)